MDKIGFNQLMTHLRPKLYRFALAFTRRTDEAEDVVQEIGVKLWERRNDLDALRSVEAYAMSAVRNECLDYARSPHNRTADLTEALHTPYEHTPYQSAEQRDTTVFVRKMIERLPEQQQSVIRLRDIEGYELEEIAEILEMNEGAVRTNQTIHSLALCCIVFTNFVVNSIQPHGGMRNSLFAHAKSS